MGAQSNICVEQRFERTFVWNVRLDEFVKKNNLQKFA